MTLNKDFIFKHIRETKYPLWALYVLQNYRRVPVMFYGGDDFKDDETIDGKIEKSINRLANALNDFPPEAVLCIELKNSKTANGSGVIGPFDFKNVSKEQAENEPAQPSGFGFINPPAGWVSEQYLNGKLEELKAENKRELGELILQQRTREFEERMEREKKELADLRKELNDEKKKYESNTGAAAETLAGAAKIIIGQLFPNLGIGPAQAPAQLEGTNDNQLPEATQPTADPKYKAVEEFAQFLYNYPGITLERLTQLKEEVQNG